MTIQNMVAMADILRARGLSEEKALHYAALIGDTPEMDGEGKLLILENGAIIDRIDPID